MKLMLKLFNTTISENMSSDLVNGKATLKWTIDYFSSLMKNLKRDDFVESETFQMEEYSQNRFFLRIYPNGFEQDNHVAVVFYFNFVTPKPIDFEFNLEVLSETGEILFSRGIDKANCDHNF